MADMQKIPPGTYTKTSKNIELQGVGEGRFRLVADCQKLDGSGYVRSELDYDIANDDGQLVWAPEGLGRKIPGAIVGTHNVSPDAPPGTYLTTCRDVSFRHDDDGHYTLRAVCKRLNGSEQPFELKYDIANNNGKLEWAPHGMSK